MRSIVDANGALMVLDHAAGQHMEKVFFQDLTHADEIDLAKFRRRPKYEHIAEWGASQLTRLL